MSGDENGKGQERGRDFDAVGPTRHLQPPAGPPGDEERMGADEQPAQEAGDAAGSEGPAAAPAPPPGAADGPGAGDRSRRGLEREPLAGRDDPQAPLTGPEAEQGVMDLFYGVLFDPADTMRSFRHRTPYGAAFLSFIAASLVSTWVMVGTVPPMLAELGLPFDTSLVPGMVMVSVSLGLLSWLVTAGIFHLAADFLGGEGRARSLFVAVGFAYLPRVFNAPLAVLDGLVAFDLGFLALAISIWIFYLFFVAIREVEGLGTLQSLAALVSPMVVLLGFAIMAVMFVLLFGASLVPLLEGIAPGI